jgi:PAS domain S-box-containing protein
MSASERSTASEPDWRRILDAVNDCVWSAVIAADGVWTFQYISPAIQRIAGRPADWFLAGRDRWLDVIHEDDRPRVDASDRALPFALRDAQKAEYRFRIVRPDGGIRWVRDVVRVSTGRPVRLDGVLSDVTEQHLAELGLRASEERLRRVVDAIPDAVLLVGADRMVTFANPAAAKLFARSRREIIGQTWEQLGVEQEPIETGKSIFRCQQYTVVRPDKSAARVLLTMATLRGAEGEFAGFVAVFDDVTALLNATERLARDEARSRALLDQLPAVVWSVDTEMKFTSSQGRGLRDLNLEPDQVVGMPVADYVGSTDPEHPALRACRKALSGLSAFFETQHMGRAYASYLEPLRGPGGVIDGAIAVSLDITNVRELESRVRQAGRLEALGQLAGGAAHDMNNLLTALMGHLNLAQKEAAGQPRVAEPLAIAAQAAERACQIAARLLGSIRTGSGPAASTDLNDAIREVVTLLAPSFGSEIHVVMRLSDEPRLVRCDSGSVHQILINLCVNARDAMPAGGRLILSTGQSPGGQTVWLEVEDTGVGIPAEILPHIFDPLFTTKPAGQGAGLGLASVRQILDRVGGRIDCRSTPGLGTTFRVEFPAGPAADEPMTAGPKSIRRRDTILLAEDEPAIRGMVREYLQEAGFTVLEAADGVGAVEVARRFNGPIPLAILDMEMPRMGGVATLAELRRVCPGLVGLIATGQPGTGPAVSWPGCAGLLEKPYRLREVLERVVALLDQRESPAD